MVPPRYTHICGYVETLRSLHSREATRADSLVIHSLFEARILKALETLISIAMEVRLKVLESTERRWGRSWVGPWLAGDGPSTRTSPHSRRGWWEVHISWHGLCWSVSSSWPSQGNYVAQWRSFVEAALWTTSPRQCSVLCLLCMSSLCSPSDKLIAMWNLFVHGMSSLFQV